MKDFTAIRELALVAGGKIFGLLSLFTCGVLVARTTGPEVYSLYAAALALVLLLDATIGSPLDWAMVRFGSLHRDEPARVERMLGGTFRLKLVIALGIGALAFLFREPLTRLLFPESSQPQLVPVILLSTLGLLALRGTAAYMQLQLRFRTYALLDMVAALIRLASVTLLFYLGIKIAPPYVAVYGLSAAATFLIGLLLIRQSYMWAPRPSAQDRRSIMRFFGATSAIIILGTISGRADILILSAMNPGESTGFYAAAAHIAVLVTLLASYAGVIVQPRVIDYAKQGRLWVLLRLNIIGGTILSVLAIPVALWLVPWFVPLLFGEAFLPSIGILQILIIGTCIDLFTMPVLQTFAIQLCSRATLTGEAVVTILFLAGAPFAAEHSPMAMAWLVTIVRILKLCIYAGIAWRYERVRKQTETAGSTSRKTQTR